MTEDEMYDIIVHNDENYDGIFFYAVKSTGIYCRPSCASKPPKRENVEFFPTGEQARRAGYRPCKRCRSDLLSYKPMEEIAKEVKQHLEAVTGSEMSWNESLQSIGMSEHRAVAVFKETYGMTPKAYTDRLRLEKAKDLLVHSEYKIIDIAHMVGFQSIATFNRFFKQETHVSPSEYRKENA